ncbi:hypothetical protein BDY19DRAFT_896215 [Irpex rosettiformis]|uniref:Uncharacterized protein n=1 Tax=Irpex rosettiformis TaxID=378272 RepID=A0ACB8TUX1_9APHY|nr:hypothetical protein BDY19DRAFT_896215 [Irpex rosettiformis]
MTITTTQKAEIESIIRTITDATVPRRKRKLAEMFLDLPDADAYPEYYEVIPNPRSINHVKVGLAKNKYKDPLQAYEDLNLVFLNAIFYNEEESQISKDASELKALLDKGWKARSALPTVPTNLPAASAQIHHNVPLPAQLQPPLASRPPAVHQPAGLPTTRYGSSVRKTPERPSSPDMDVDVGGTPEPETVAMETALDGEGDAIVQQLERSLPRWEGFANVGWSRDIPQDRFLSLVEAISGHQCASGKRSASYLEALPENTDIAELPYKEPLSLALIEKRVRDNHYTTSEQFDKDMSKLFLKGRRSYGQTTEGYGQVLLLQRLYQALVSVEPPSGPPYVSTTNFASLPASPGTARPLHSSQETDGMPSITTFRISVKDRKFVEQVEYKGWTIKMADWLHLANCDDPSRPIIGHVFRCWVSEESSKKGQAGVTVAWYYRPEQTWHPAQRQFWESEVFKTSHFAEHPLDDIIEKVACQFTARHIRGRPRPPYWHPGWPLYVCDSRYNDRERIFVRIKNWNSCVPEEVRKSAEFMPIYPFERSVYPKRYASPFITSESIKAPGGIGDMVERGEGEKHEGGGIGLYVGPPLPGTSTHTTTQPIVPLAPYDPPTLVQSRNDVDRSIVTASGGASALGGQIVVDRLSTETARHFDRDPETNEVLWFPAPPIDIPRPKGPKYNLTYLAYLARKRKNKDDDGAVDVDSNLCEEVPNKRHKAQLITAAEQLQTLLAHGANPVAS